MMDDYMMVSSYIATALLLVVLPIYLLLLFLGAITVTIHIEENI